MDVANNANSAGCSPCACGIAEACPGYLDPSWYNALIIAVVVAILLLFVYIFIKPRPKLLRNIMILCMIVAISIGSLVAYKTISGYIESEASNRDYEKCLEYNNSRSQGPVAACEI